jgi:hypothetical protein
MKTKAFIIASFQILCFYGFCMAQEPIFKIYGNMGQVELKSGENKSPLKTGAYLKDGDVIIIGDKGYVALVHSATGTPKELRTPGNYSVKDLAAQIKPGSSLVTKYTEFILSSSSPEAKKNRLSATGAVHRGLEDIHVYLPEQPNTKTLNNTAFVRWESKSGNNGPYIVKLDNMYGDELIKIETNDPAIKIDLNDPKLSNEQDIFLKITVKNDSRSTSRDFIIHKLRDQARIAELKKELQEFDPEQESAFNKIILAGFFEQQKLFIDAISAYEDALSLAPEVTTYREAYDEFLIRNRLKEPKQ